MRNVNILRLGSIFPFLCAWFGTGCDIRAQRQTFDRSFSNFGKLRDEAFLFILVWSVK